MEGLDRPLGDLPTDRERGRRGRRRRVPDVENVARTAKPEIVHEPPVTVQRLGSDAGRPEGDLLSTELWHVSPERPQERLLRPVPPELGGGGSLPVRRRGRRSGRPTPRRRSAA